MNKNIIRLLAIVSIFVYANCPISWAEVKSTVPETKQVAQNNQGFIDQATFLEIRKNANGILSLEDLSLLKNKRLTYLQQQGLFSELRQIPEARYPVYRILRSARASHDEIIPRLGKLVNSSNPDLAGFSAWILGKIGKEYAAWRKEMPNKYSAIIFLQNNANNMKRFRYPGMPDSETIGKACRRALQNIE